MKVWCLMSLIALPCLTASATASICRATSSTGMLSSRITRQIGAKNSYLQSRIAPERGDGVAVQCASNKQLVCSCLHRCYTSCAGMRSASMPVQDHPADVDVNTYFCCKFMLFHSSLSLGCAMPAPRPMASRPRAPRIISINCRQGKGRQQAFF